MLEMSLDSLTDIQYFGKHLSSLVWKLNHLPRPYEATVANLEDGRRSRFSVWGRFFSTDVEYVTFDMDLEVISQFVLDEEAKVRRTFFLTPVGSDSTLCHKRSAAMYSKPFSWEKIEAAVEEERKFLDQVKKPLMIDGKVQFPSPYRYRLAPDVVFCDEWFPIYPRNIGGYSGCSDVSYLPKDLVPNLNGQSYDIVIKGYTVNNT
jgi:hypothetical protein